MSDKFLPIYDRSNQAMRTNTGKDYQWKIPTASMWTTSHQVLNLNALPSTWTELVAKVKVNTSLTYYDWSSPVGERTVTINRAFLIHFLKDEIDSDTGQPSNRFGVGSSRIVPSANSSVIVQPYDYNVSLYVDKNMISLTNTYSGVYAYGKEITSGISLDVVYR